MKLRIRLPCQSSQITWKISKGVSRQQRCAKSPKEGTVEFTLIRAELCAALGDPRVHGYRISGGQSPEAEQEIGHRFQCGAHLDGGCCGQGKG